MAREFAPDEPIVSKREFAPDVSPEPAKAKEKPPLPSMFGAFFGGSSPVQPEAEAKGSAAALRGLTSGILGAPGGIESIITPSAKGKLKGKETVFPTPEEIREGYSKLGLEEPKTKELQAAQMAGEFAPVGAQLLTAGLPALGRGLKTALSSGAEMLVGRTTPSVEELARKFESKGFKFEPGQLREKKPLGSPGYSTPQMRNNQALANELTTAETGSTAGFGKVTKEHLEKTQKALGKVYSDIFSKNFQIDEKLASAAQKAAEFEAAVDPAKVNVISKTADNINRRWEEIQLLNQKLAPYRKGPIVPLSEPPPMSTSMKRQWSNLVAATDKAALEYAAEIQKTIDELAKNLNLAVKPKVSFGIDRSGTTFGMASSDGHIVVRRGLDKEGTIATALHEFGHQAEFHLLRNAPSNVQADIYKAFQEHRRTTPLGKTTVEQYRPLTAAKYGEEFRTSIPGPKYEQDYLRNFSEWYAEQTQRWITTTKAPTNTVEKFFANVAKMWKEVYKKVTGHVGLSKEVEEFYRSSWKPNLIQEAAAEQRAVSTAASNVAGDIKGTELQALRSNLSDLTHRLEGQDKYRPSQLLQEIDEAIARSNPETAAKFLDTNRKYAANSTLLELERRNGIMQGNVSLEKLGNLTKYNQSNHPLYELGMGGRQLKLRGMYEGAELPSGELASLLNRSKRFALGVVTDSPAARSVQRKISEP